MRVTYGPSVSGRLALAIAIILAASNAGCREPIAHGVTEERANRARLLLARAGITASTEQNGASWNVSVPRSDLNRAIEIITRGRILREEPQLDSAPAGLTVTGDERERAAEREQTRLLEHSLQLLPGVLEARVHLRFHSSRRTLQLEPLFEPMAAATGRPSGGSSAAVDATVQSQRNPLEGMIPRRGTASVLLIVDDEWSLDERTAVKLISGGTGISPGEVQIVLCRIVLFESQRAVQAVREPKGSSIWPGTVKSLGSAISQYGMGAAALVAVTVLMFLWRWRAAPAARELDEDPVLRPLALKSRENGAIEQ